MARRGVAAWSWHDRDRAYGIGIRARGPEDRARGTVGQQDRQNENLEKNGEAAGRDHHGRQALSPYRSGPELNTTIEQAVAYNKPNATIRSKSIGGRPGWR